MGKTRLTVWKVEPTPNEDHEFTDIIERKGLIQVLA
jgi:hypothetical protein